VGACAILSHMPRRKMGEEHVRKIQKSKGSYHISVPINIIRELGWKERQKVVVKKRGRGVLIVDWEK